MRVYNRVLTLMLCTLLATSAHAAGFKQLDLLVTDFQNDRVLVIDPTTGALSVLSPAPGAGVNLLDQPIGITVASDGTVYTVNSGDNHLIQIDPLTGDQLVVPVFVPGLPVGHFEPLFIGQMPISIDVDASGDLYVAAQASFEVRKITGVGTSALNSVQLAQDAAFQQVSDLVVNGSLLEITSRLTGIWQVPTAGGNLDQRMGLVSGKPLRLVGVGLDLTSEIGLFSGLNTPSGGCEPADAGVYKLVHFAPVPGSPGFDDWVPQSVNAPDGFGPYECLTSLAVADDTTFFVGQSNAAGGWISKVVTSQPANVTVLASLPDGPAAAFPGAIAIAPVTVPEPDSRLGAAAGLLGLLALRARSRPRAARSLSGLPQGFIS